MSLVPENKPLVAKKSARAVFVLRNKKVRETRKELSIVQLLNALEEVMVFKAYATNK